jgi:hypothetical protein
MHDRLLISLILLTSGGCSVQKDRFVKFESQVGNSIIAPSQWKSDDRGAVWYLESPDSTAALTVFTFTVEGSGSLDDLRTLVVANRLGEVEGGWRETPKPSLTLEQAEAQVFDLAPAAGESKSRNRLCLLQTGRMYHILVINTSEAGLELNGDFYNSIFQTFVGRE